MVQSVFENIQIEGIMAAVPKKSENIMEVYGKKFGEKAVASFSRIAGVEERRVALEEQTASDFAFVAARELLEKKSVNREEIGVLIFVTQTPDYKVPATAFVLHKRLGLSKNCVVFDVNLGCSGYVYGMQIICSLLKTTGISYGLLLVGDTSTRDISPEDKSTAMLFGDGGSATLLHVKKDAGVIRTGYRSDGSGFKNIIAPAGANRNRKSSAERKKWGDGNVRSDYELYMDGVNVFSFSISEVPELINDFLEITGQEKESYDAYVFHQANCYILKQITKVCKLSKDKVPVSMDRYGNTSVTSISLTICDKYGEMDGEQSIHILACGFGVGMSWGIVDFQIRQEDIYPVIETDEYYKEGGVSHV